MAFSWSNYKGLDVFIELARRLPHDYKIVMVGTNDAIDTILPRNIISIHKTQNQTELAMIYTAADLLINPTREDNFPTVNIVALACGTPVLTFNTNGSPEIIDNTCGVVVPYGDINMMESEIKRIVNEHLFVREACVERAKQYKRTDQYEEYITIYEC